MSEVVVSPPRLRLCLALLGGLAFVALGFMMLQWTSVIANIVGILSILFFGYCFIIGIRSFFDHRLDLIIDESGIRHRHQGYGLIVWDDIEGFDLQNNLLLIKVRNIDKYISRLSGLGKLTSKIDGDLERGLLSIGLANLGLSADDMLRILRANAPTQAMKVIDSSTLGPKVK